MVATAKPCDSEGTPASAQTTSSRCRPAGDFLSHTTACLGLQCLLQAPMASRGTHPVRRFLAHTTGWEALRSIACTAGSSASAQGAQLRLLQRLHLARCLGHLVVIPRVLTRCQQAVGPGWSWTMSLQPVRCVHTSGSNIRPLRPEGLMISNDDRGRSCAAPPSAQYLPGDLRGQALVAQGKKCRSRHGRLPLSCQRVFPRPHREPSPQRAGSKWTTMSWPNRAHSS